MSPQYYIQIRIAILTYQILSVTTFSIIDFLSHIDKEIAINSLAQLASYTATKSVGNNFNPSNILPVISNLKIGNDFIQMASTVSQQRQRVATLALLYSTAGSITKVGDITSNVSMEALLAAFGDYMISTINTHNTPFIYRRPIRLLPRFTFKCQLKLTSFFYY